MGGFPHLEVRLVPLFEMRSFPVLRSTIVKETASGQSFCRHLTRKAPAAGKLLVIFVKGKR